MAATVHSGRTTFAATARLWRSGSRTFIHVQLRLSDRYRVIQVDAGNHYVHQPVLAVADRKEVNRFAVRGTRRSAPPRLR